MAKAGTVWIDVRADTKGFAADLSRATQGASRSLGGLAASGAKAVFGDIAQTAGIAAIGVAGLGAAAVKTSMEFSASMSGVGAVAGATAAEMELLREAALDAGAATVFSASEAAIAEQELVKAGISVSDVLGGALTGSLALAAAGQLELGNAAEIAAQAMNIFGLAGEDVGYVADVLAAGANKSAADVKQLGDALRQGGLLAAQTGLSMEDTVGVLSLFADNALIGSDAGTSLKTMLQRLAPTSKEAAGAMMNLGLSFFDAEGAFVGIEEAAQRMQVAFKDLSDEERSMAMTRIFGSDAVRAANLLYEAGAAGVREYTDAVSDEGAAVRMAAAQLDNLKGDIEEFSGATETALIRLGDLMDGANRSVVQAAAGFVNVFNDFAKSPAWRAIETNLNRVTAGAGGVFDDLADQLDAMLSAIRPQDVDRAFDAVGSGLERTRAAVEGLEPVIAGVGVALSTMALRSIPIVGQLAPAISPITGVLAGLVLGSEEGRDALSFLAREASELASSVGPQLLGSLADLSAELSEGLASVLEDVGGAAIRAAEILGPVLSDAISDLAPVIGDLLEAGGELAGEVLPMLADMAGAVLPPAVDLLGGALSLAADATSLLADNLWLLAPAAGAFVAIRFGDQLTNLGRQMSTIASSAGTAAQNFGTYFGVLRAEGATVGQALRGAAAESSNLADGLASKLNPALIGVAGAVTVGVLAYQQYAENKGRVRDITNGLVDALDEERSKFFEMTSERARQTFADKEALGVQNQLGMSLVELTELSALYGNEVRRLDEKWLQAGQNLDLFRSLLEDFPEPVREVGLAIADLADQDLITNRQALGFFQALDELAQGTAGSLENAKEQFESLAREAAAAGDITSGELARVLDAINTASTPAELNDAFNQLSVLLGGVGSAAAGAANDVERLANELADLAGIERDVDAASRAAKDAIQGVLDSYARNGAGIDENTEAGRRNADAIRRMVESQEALAKAQARTDTTGRTSLATMQELQRSLFRLKEAGVITAEEYQHLLDLYDLTPSEIQTKIDADTRAAQTELEDIKRRILDTPGVTEEEKARINAVTSLPELRKVEAEIGFVARNREAKINVSAGLTPEARALLASIPGGIGRFGDAPRPAPNLSGFTGKKRAAGGSVWPDETFLVGEKGPELVEFGAAGRVIDARTTERIMAPKAEGGDEFGAALLDEFRAMRAEMAAIASRPTFGALNQYGGTAESSPEDLVRGVRKAHILVGA